MKVPIPFRQKKAELGPLVAAGSTPEPTAVAKLTAIAMRDRAFVRDIVADYVARSLHSWVTKHGGPAGDPNQPSLFPDLDLPRQLEVSPNRFMPIGDMTRTDWAAARRQARTKADNAAGYADLLDEAYERVEHLLTDDSLTTAQVLGRAA